MNLLNCDYEESAVATMAATTAAATNQNVFIKSENNLFNQSNLVVDFIRYPLRCFVHQWTVFFSVIMHVRVGAVPMKSRLFITQKVSSQQLFFCCCCWAKYSIYRRVLDECAQWWTNCSLGFLIKWYRRYLCVNGFQTITPLNRFVEFYLSVWMPLRPIIHAAKSAKHP